MKKRRNVRRKNKRMRWGLFFLGLAVLAAVVWKIQFSRQPPYAYDAYIERYAAKNKLDQALVAAVIYQESRYREKAESAKGAQGLMQIMPDTAKWIGEHLKIPYSKERVMDPETNIRMGTWYLRTLLDQYQEDEMLALAAYNAGPGNVDEWLKDPRWTRGGRLNKIPFAETEKYVESVMRMKEVYRKMYQERLPKKKS
ncbi:Soluble lytic murein transglycosylase precursor [Clostridiaceae bacterium JG1575]|nr:Soluble lytic murein transglycosylase precursor [Clostridiaceae bacterium JG1575]